MSYLHTDISQYVFNHFSMLTTLFSSIADKQEHRHFQTLQKSHISARWHKHNIDLNIQVYLMALVVESIVLNVAPKSSTGVKLGWDLVTKGYISIYIIFILTKSVSPDVPSICIWFISICFLLFVHVCMLPYHNQLLCWLSDSDILLDPYCLQTSYNLVNLIVHTVILCWPILYTQHPIHVFLSWHRQPGHIDINRGPDN